MEVRGRLFSLVERRQGLNSALGEDQIGTKSKGFPKGEGSLGSSG